MDDKLSLYRVDGEEFLLAPEQVEILRVFDHEVVEAPTERYTRRLFENTEYALGLEVTQNGATGLLFSVRGWNKVVSAEVTLNEETVRELALSLNDYLRPPKQESRVVYEHSPEPDRGKTLRDADGDLWNYSEEKGGWAWVSLKDDSSGSAPTWEDVVDAFRESFPMAVVD